MGIRFLQGEPVLVLENGYEKYVVLADLHFGSPVFSDIDTSIAFINDDCRRIIDACKKVSCNRVIVIGDVKETLSKPNTTITNAILDCFRNIFEVGANIFIVLGNHDGGLSSLLSDVANVFRDYLSLDIVDENKSIKAILTHGHRKLPMETLLNTDVVISAHLHPGFRLNAQHASIVVKSWVIIDLELEKEKEVKWIILPSFSSLINGIAINDINNDYLIDMSPFPKKIDMRIIDRKYFLLDLTPMF